jgi:hypothetical protein
MIAQPDHQRRVAGCVYGKQPEVVTWLQANSQAAVVGQDSALHLVADKGFRVTAEGVPNLAGLIRRQAKVGERYRSFRKLKTGKRPGSQIAGKDQLRWNCPPEVSLLKLILPEDA